MVQTLMTYEQTIIRKGYEQNNKERFQKKQGILFNIGYEIVLKIG